MWPLSLRDWEASLSQKKLFLDDGHYQHHFDDGLEGGLCEQAWEGAYKRERINERFEEMGRFFFSSHVTNKHSSTRWLHYKRFEKTTDKRKLFDIG